MMPPGPTRRRDTWGLVGAAAAYFFAHELAFLFPAADRTLVLIWPASGIGLAAFLLNPRRVWLRLAVVLFFTATAANLSFGRPWAVSFGFATADVLESLGSAWLVAQVGGERVRFGRMREVSMLLLAVAGVNTLTSLVGAGTAAAVASAPFWPAWHVGWVAHGLGLLVVGPLVVVWADLPPPRPPRLSARRLGEIGAFLAMWTVIGWLIFNRREFFGRLEPRPYVMIGLIVWGALRLGPRVVTTAVALLALIVITSDAVRHGSLPWGGADLSERLLLAQAYVGATAIIGLLLAASTTESKAARASVAALGARHRTLLECANDGIHVLDAAGQVVEVNEAFCRMLGYSREELLRLNVADFDAHLSPGEHRVRIGLLLEHPEVFESVHRRKDGSLVPVEINAVGVTLEGHRHLYASARDISARKRVAAALQASEARYQQIERAVNDGLWDWNLLTGDAYLSPRWKAILGYADAELPNTADSHFDNLHPDDREAARAAVRRHLAEGDRYEHEFRLRHKDGAYRWVLSRGEAIRDAAGRAVRLVGSMTDITERKLAEAALRESEEKFATVFHDAPVWIAIADLADAHCLEVNDHALEASGYTREEAIGRTAVELGWMRAEDRDALVQAMRQSGQVDGFEMTFRTKDGRSLRGLVTCRLIIIGGRRCSLTVTVDITKRKQAEEALRASEEKFATVFRDAPTGMAIRDAASGRYVDTNDRCLALTGYSRAEVIGRTPKEIGFWVEETGGDEHPLVQPTEGGGVEHDVRLRHKSGRIVYCSQSSHPIRIGDRPCFLSITVDITARKQAELELRESENMLRESQKVAALGSYVLDFVTGSWKSSAILDEIFGIDARFDRSVPGWISLIAPADQNRMADYLAQEVIGQRRAFDQCYRIIRADDGAERWVQGFGELEYDADARLRKMRGTIQDVTERKRAEMALRQSEERYRMLVELSPEAVFVHGGGRIVFANQAAARLLLAKQAEELVGRPVLEFVQPEFHDPVRSRIEQMADGVVAPLMRQSWRRVDGSPVEVMAVASRVEFNAQPASLVIALDVTVQIRAEAELRKLSRAVEQSPVTVVITDATGAIEYVNPSFTAKTGYTFEEARGLNPRLLRSGELPAEMYRDLWQTISSGREWRGEFHNRKKNGELFWETATISPIADAEGRITHYLAVKEDITERKRGEATLAASERRFRLLVESVPNIAVQGYDRQRRVIFWNAASADLYGYTEAEALGRRLEDLIIPPEMREGVVAAVEGLVERDEPIPAGELTLRRKDGSAVSVYSSHVKLERADGECEMHCIDIDLTERKQVERALAAAHDFHLRILSQVPALIWRSGPDENPDWFNEGWLEFTGRSLARQTGEGWLTGVHPDDHDALRATFGAAYAARDAFETEFRLRRADGEYRTVLARGVPFTALTGDFGGFLGYGVDITERRSAEERIREQAALLDVAQDAILVTDLDRTVRYWNRAAERMYGIKSGHACGQRYEALVYRQVPPDHEGAWAQAIRDGAWTGDRQHVSREGRRLDVRVRGTIVLNPVCGSKSVLVVITDITESKKLEAQFLRAQRLESLGALASGVAHDLNNVLTPILMSVELLRPLARVKSDHDMLQLLNDSARRGADIVQQLLLFGRGSDSPRAPVSAGGVIKEVGQMMRQTFPKSLVLSVQAPADLRLIEADRTQIHQVLLNLCVNSRDAMPHGGRLSVRAENCQVDEVFAQANGGTRAGAYVRIEVKDSGHGIPAAHLEKIFDPFFTTKPVGEGTGLGLATVLGIVRSHGGFLVVNSPEGAGTVFEVYLPVARSAVEGATEGATQPTLVGHGECVLVVDDEEWIRNTLQRLLTRNRYRVLMACDGAEALGVFAQHAEEVKLVISDVMMPVMDGAQMMNALRRLNAELPCVAMSGLPSHRAEFEKKFGPRLHFLPKPFTAELALRVVREALDGVDPAKA